MTPAFTSPSTFIFNPVPTAVFGSCPFSKFKIARVVFTVTDDLQRNSTAPPLNCTLSSPPPR